jgi:hypothetical protein
VTGVGADPMRSVSRLGGSLCAMLGSIIGLPRP